jgi:hypothetical protein
MAHFSIRQSRVRIPLTRLNATLRINVPLEFKRRHGLTEEDQVEWIEDETGVHLKFLRTSKAEEVAVEAA